jgi:hypothetical protein
MIFRVLCSFFAHLGQFFVYYSEDHSRLQSEKLNSVDTARSHGPGHVYSQRAVRRLPLSSLQAKSTGVDLPVMVCLGGFFQAKYNQPSIISVRPGPTEFWRTRPGPRTCILQTRPRLEYSHVGIWLPPHPRSQFYDFVRPPPDLIHRARRTAAGLRSSSVTLGCENQA